MLRPTMFSLSSDPSRRRPGGGLSKSMHNVPVLLLLVIALFVPSCDSSLVGPDGFLVPEADPSLDPARVQVGDFLATPCGERLDHLRGNERWITVDIDFPGETAPPDEGDIRMVRDHGAWVYHTFNVRQARARIVTSRIPDMVEETRVTVRSVPDPARYDVRAIVGFDRPMASGDRQMLEGLGAHVSRITGQWTQLTAFIEVPDRSIPALRDRSDLRYLSHGGIYCL